MAYRSHYFVFIVLARLMWYIENTIMQTISKTKIILEKGKPSEVILKWKDFQELLEKIEDIYDLSEIRKIKNKKPTFKNFDELLKNYVT